MAEIDRDLIRWRRGKWAAAIAFFLALQLAVLFFTSEQAVGPRTVYPQEPVMALHQPSIGTEWGDVENPFLFASASLQGFSGEAWLRRPEWKPPVIEQQAPTRFLRHFEITTPGVTPPEIDRPIFGQRRQTTALLPPPKGPRPQERRSELRLEGDRRLVSEPSLPTQVHNDILSNSVVEALVGRDGLVISARLIENSGSPKADADALALARNARFLPRGNGDDAADLAKLIFQWHALDLNSTNGLNSRSNNVGRQR